MKNQENKKTLEEYLTKSIAGLQQYKDGIKKQIEATDLEVAKMVAALDEIDIRIKAFEDMLSWVKKQ